MLCKAPRESASDARSGLSRGKIPYAAQARCSAPPEIAVQRSPSAGLEVMAKMAFKRADRRFCLRLRHRASVECRIRGVKPCPAVSVEHPVSPSLGITKLRLESPAIDTPVDQFGGIVLSRRSNDLQDDAQQHLLLPLHELRGFHGRAALQVHRHSRHKVQQPRTIDLPMLLEQLTLKGSNAVWQRSHYIGRATEEVERMVQAEDRHAESPGPILHGNCS